MRALLEANRYPLTDPMAALAIENARLADKTESMLDRISTGRSVEGEEALALRITEQVVGRFGTTINRAVRHMALKGVGVLALGTLALAALTGLIGYGLGHGVPIRTDLGPVSRENIALVQRNGGLDAILNRCGDVQHVAGGGTICALPRLWLIPPPAPAPRPRQP